MASWKIWQKDINADWLIVSTWQLTWVCSCIEIIDWIYELILMVHCALVNTGLNFGLSKGWNYDNKSNRFVLST